MAMMEAFLDDFGTVRVNVSKNLFNGDPQGFFLTDEEGKAYDCVIRGVEPHERVNVFTLTIPADFRFGVSYYLQDGHGRIIPLQNRFIVQTPTFNKMFDYDGDDLGSTYHIGYTDFALWAPTATGVSVKLMENGQATILRMKRTEKGVYRLRVKGNLKHALYVYLIERDGQVVISNDPYALSSNANGRASAVIDESELSRVVDNAVLPVLGSYTDAILYETNVRDMTSNANSGTKAHGTFMALCERGTQFEGYPTGLDYLSTLGVTHIQLQPVNDFATVDENHPNRSYNWGYDPAQLMVPEGSYSSDPEDPYARVLEFKRLVSSLHKTGLRVILDVVFNHMYDVEATSLHRSVPYYYFRYNASGYLSNGSWCGNDIESRRPMVRRYLKTVVSNWMRLYGVDGFRFDLMGILDVDTMNMLKDTVRSIKKDAMVYGEGWDLPTELSGEEKAMIINQNRMPFIGHFNDTFRDVLKGHTGDYEMADRGYLTGNTSLAHEACSSYLGQCIGTPYFRRFDSPVQSINALETHDNATTWDKMHRCCGEESREQRHRRQKMMIASVLVAQGVPFLHAGQEYCGTKNDCTNSYNSGDAINGMNWDRMRANIQIVEYTRACIQLRKRFAGFRLRTAEEIRTHVHMAVAENDVVFYDITDVKGEPDLRVLVNPNLFDVSYDFPEEWRVELSDTGTQRESYSRFVHVPQCSVVVCSKRKDD